MSAVQFYGVEPQTLGVPGRCGEGVNRVAHI